MPGVTLARATRRALEPDEYIECVAKWASSRVGFRVATWGHVAKQYKALAARPPLQQLRLQQHE